MHDNYELFNDLNDTQRENFVAACKEHSYEPEAEIMTRGNHGEHVFFLIQGKVRVVVPEREEELAVLEPPAVVGEMELLTGRPRSASVIAVTRSRLLAMPFDVMRNRVRDGDAAALKVVAKLAIVLANRLAIAVDKLVALEQKKQIPLDELQDFRRKLFSDWTF